MRTETITRNLYTFEELNDKAKEKARDWWRGAACHDEWWGVIYEDAEIIGLKITGFDTGRGEEITGYFTLSACEVAANIFRDHGGQCDTRKTAEEFLKEWNPVYADYLDEKSAKYESREAEEKMMELEEDFLRSLLEDYLASLRKEEEWYFSNEQVDEAILCNACEFLESGERS